MLRALLRQDPDVIMLGEMRDAETTNIALPGVDYRPPRAVHECTPATPVATVTRLRNIGVPVVRRRLGGATASWRSGLGPRPSASTARSLRRRVKRTLHASAA
jgi:hypothetical protein